MDLGGNVLGKLSGSWLSTYFPEQRDLGRSDPATLKKGLEIFVTLPYFTRYFSLFYLKGNFSTVLGQ